MKMITKESIKNSINEFLENSTEEEIKELKCEVYGVLEKHTEPLSEFEIALFETLDNCTQYHNRETLKVYAERLLNVAKKEIEKELPVWRRCLQNNSGWSLGRTTVRNGDYYIKLSELEKLPKEDGK